MNRKTLAAVLALGTLAAAGGLWLSIRRQPAGALLADDTGAFKAEPCGPGILLRLQDPMIPLRALRWLGPLRGGLMAAQVLTQSDRQQVVFFRDGQPGGEVLVTKPAGIAEGFWRFATLKEVLALPGGDVALLYIASDAASAEPSVLIALDPAHGDVRWTHRGAFQRLALSEGKDPALFCFGGGAPIQRLPLAAAGAGEAGRAAPNAAAKTIALPPEIPAVEDLLPTGSGTFLVSHAQGLAAFKGGAWTHFPAPGDHGVPCLGWHSALVRAGRRLWWQAWPGRLIEVKADGSGQSDWAPEAPGDAPFAPDAQLLRLLGVDAAGALWFALAPPVLASAGQGPGATPAASPAASPGTTPATPAPASAPAAVPPAPQVAAAAPPGGTPPSAAEPAVPGAPEAGPAPSVDWQAYMAQGLNRIYRWNPARHALERFSWSQDWASLKPPPELSQPVTEQTVCPEAGALLIAGPRSAWWLPLAALPLR